MTSDEPSPPASPSVAERLERLFAVQRPPGEPRRPWRNSEVVAACRSAGRELSESHLSELRRGIKLNPTLRVLETLAWFFEVRVGYFTDPDVARAVEADLAERERILIDQMRADQAAEDEEAAAAQELRAALRRSGAGRTAHRGFDRGQSRERASMMRALAQALGDETEAAEQPGHDERGGRAEPEA